MKKNKKLLYFIFVFVILGIIFYFLIHNGIIFLKVTLNESNLKLSVGDGFTLTYVTNNDDKKAYWYSLDSSIVTIDDRGNIEARKSGQTKVYLEYGNVKKYCDVTVSDALVNSIKLNKNELEMSVDDDYQLEYEILPSIAADKNVTWNSSNNEVAIIDNGIVKATGLGEAIITITSSNGIKDECKITVNNVNVKELVINKKDISLNKGGLYQLNVNILPENASNKTLLYSSSNPDVVEVNSNGLIKAKTSGTSTITITSLNGIKVTCSIVVSSNEIITYKDATITNNGKRVTITVNDDNYKELVVNTYYGGNIVDNKSIRQNNDNYVVTLDKVGKWEIETYLVYDNNQSSKYKYSYGIATLSSIKDNLSMGLNSISFDDKNNVLLFGSDFQGSESKNNVKSILSKINSLGIKVGLLGFLGDYSASYSASTSTNGLKELNNTIRSFNNFQNTGTIYLQGNHDPINTTGLLKTGEYETDSYSIFIINEDDYPSGNTGLNKIQQATSKLDNYLNNLVTYNVKKPVFVLTHVPLHYSSRKDNGYSSYIINVLNKYGDKLDIIFMYGHNHSGSYDDCLGGSINYISKSDNMSYYMIDSRGKGKTNTAKINFTYLNAGYVGYIRNANREVSCNGNKVMSYNTPALSLFKINDKDIVIEKYNSSGIVKTYTINRVN